MDMIKELEAIVVEKEKELEAMKPILDIAEKQASTMDKYSDTVKLKNLIENYVESTLYKIHSLKKEIAIYQNIERPHPIEVMHFRAGHRSFRPDEFKKIQEKLHAFLVCSYNKMPTH